MERDSTDGVAHLAVFNNQHMFRCMQSHRFHNVRVSFASGRNHSSILPRPSSLRLHFGEGPFKILLSTRSGHLLTPGETPEYSAPLWAWFRMYIFHKREYDLSHLFALIYSSHVDHVIYQTRETVFYWGIQTPRRELKIRRASEYF